MAKTWQETVMDDDELLGSYYDKASPLDGTTTIEGLREVALDQAKETFKAGEDKAREVVEWIAYCPKCGSYLPKNLNGTRTLKCRNCNWDGQAKLKEWFEDNLELLEKWGIRG